MDNTRGLFRGKRTDNGEWVTGYFGRHTSLDAMIIDRPYPAQSGELAALHHWMVDPDTRGEYTGLTDKNGKMIFEGDIVTYHKPLVPWCHDIEDGMIGEVTRSGSAFYMEVRRSDLMSGRYLLNSFFGAHGNVLEVIGNIHDNGELIGGQNG